MTALDAFWAQAQLAELPCPDHVLGKLRSIDLELYDNLREGELWLLKQTDVEGLRSGWAWWLKLYREAVEIVDLQMLRELIERLDLEPLNWEAAKLVRRVRDEGDQRRRKTRNRRENPGSPDESDSKRTGTQPLDGGLFHG